jgi:hypothetical protein
MKWTHIVACGASKYRVHHAQFRLVVGLVEWLADRRTLNIHQSCHSLDGRSGEAIAARRRLKLSRAVKCADRAVLAMSGNFSASCGSALRAAVLIEAVAAAAFDAACAAANVRRCDGLGLAASGCFAAAVAATTMEAVLLHSFSVSSLVSSSKHANESLLRLCASGFWPAAVDDNAAAPRFGRLDRGDVEHAIARRRALSDSLRSFMMDVSPTGVCACVGGWGSEGVEFVNTLMIVRCFRAQIQRVFARSRRRSHTFGVAGMLARIGRLRGGSSASASASAPLRGVAPPDATSARCSARVTGRNDDSDDGEVIEAASPEEEAVVVTASCAEALEAEVEEEAEDEDDEAGAG